MNEDWEKIDPKQILGVEEKKRENQIYFVNHFFHTKHLFIDVGNVKIMN